MQVFPFVDLETFLVGLESDTVANIPSKHHLSAVHIVVHDIFKFWLQSLFINQVEEDLIISGDLQSLVSLDVEYHASCMNDVILLPESSTCHIIYINFEEENITGASGNKGLSVNKEHLT